MKKFILAFLTVCSMNATAQIEPVATYEGGDLYFVPSKLTSNGIAFMYSYRSDYQSGKSWFCIFDDEVNVVKQAEIEPDILNYTIRTITYQRRFFIPGSPTRATRSDSAGGYFLDNWTITSDITEEKTEKNQWMISPEVYEDNNNYHSRYMYLSQTLFNDDEDFELLRAHYEVMPLTYCAAEDESEHYSIIRFSDTFGGEECEEYRIDYNQDLGGYVYTLIRHKIYGGLKNTGTDVVSLDGTIKKTLDGITDLGTVVAINGKYYVSAYDGKSSKYGLYKIATATTNLSKVADISAETYDNATYNLAGIRVKADTKGVIVRNGRKYINHK